jgi:tetratricopeptide (TPR) repeat protein
MSLVQAGGLLAVWLAGGVSISDRYHDMLRRAADAPETEVETLHTLANWRKSDLDELARGLDPSLQLHRAAIVVHTETALALRAGGEPAPGFVHLEMARAIAARLEQDTPFRQAWLLAIGAEMVARSDAPLALDLFVECRTAFPKAAEAWLGAGAVYEWSAFPDGLGGPRVLGRSSALARDAERAYRAALALDPSLAEARVRLGRVLQRLGRGDEAQRELERAARDSQDAAMRGLAHLFLGQIRERRGDAGGAIREYRAALTAVPSLQPAAIALSALLAGRGERDEAIAALREPLRAGAPDEMPLWLAYRLGSPSRAKQAFTRLREEIRP